jgi:prophage maintenance system killer protein
MAVFLGLNGYEVEAPEAEVVTVMVSIAAGGISEARVAVWVRGHIVPGSAS